MTITKTKDKAKVHVLLVEDSIDDQEYFIDLLQHSSKVDFAIEACTTAIKGLDKIRDTKFDCLVIDYNMPGKNGMWLIDQVRIINSHIPIIMLTGVGDEQIAVQALKKGAQDYIPKLKISQYNFPEVILAAIAEKRREHRLLSRASKNALVELAERKMFMQQLGLAVDHAAQNDKPMALVFLDVKNVSAINLEFGGVLADRVLDEVADRTQNSLHQSDSLARLGGDKYVVLLKQQDKSNESYFDEAIQQIVKIITYKKYTIGDKKIKIEVRVGVAIYPHSADKKEDLISIADKAMYDSKY